MDSRSTNIIARHHSFYPHLNKKPATNASSLWDGNHFFSHFEVFSPPEFKEGSRLAKLCHMQSCWIARSDYCSQGLDSRTYSALKQVPIWFLLATRNCHTEYCTGPKEMRHIRVSPLAMATQNKTDKLRLGRDCIAFRTETISRRVHAVCRPTIPSLLVSSLIGIDEPLHCV